MGEVAELLSTFPIGRPTRLSTFPVGKPTRLSTFPVGKPTRLRFAGYAALFDLRDRGGDVVRRGAFAGAGAPLPLLWQHDPAHVIGSIERLDEDARGLRVIGVIEGRETAGLLRAGAVTGLSFGYRVKGARAGPPGRGGAATRELTALELVEVSLVSRPMQPGARVTMISTEE